MQAGRIIKHLRISEGVQQDALANDLGVTRAYLSQIENGREPSLAFLRSAAKRFRAPLALFLVDGEGDDPELNQELRTLVEKLLSARVTLWSGQKGQDEPA